jgi:glucose-1-phosphate cytidylyltransferase
VKVVILCGGLGTRLREETEYRPKPMVPVGGRPILWHIMKTYAHFGHKEFILCLGYKGEVIKDYFRNYLWNTSDVTLRLGRNPQIKYHSTHEEEDWTVTLLETGMETQTGGRLRRAMAHVHDENFLFTYGDGLTDSDINASIAFHKAHGAIATVTAVRPTGRFGELAIDKQTITAFREKPEQERAYISGGFMVLDRSVAKYLDRGDGMIFEREPMEKLAADGQLKAYCHDGFWQCMDTYREQQLLDKMWTARKAPWAVWEVKNSAPGTAT